MLADGKVAGTVLEVSVGVVSPSTEVITTSVGTALKVGVKVVALSIGAIPTSVTSSKVSPRATEGREFWHMKKSKELCSSPNSLISAMVLTFFRACHIKVPTTASIVHTHGVTLTFPLRLECATVTHTGLCGNAVCLFQCEMTCSEMVRL